MAYLYFRAIPLGPDQLLLRGAMLRNTNWIFGKFNTLLPALVAQLDVGPTCDQEVAGSTPARSATFCRGY